MIEVRTDGYTRFMKAQTLDAQKSNQKRSIRKAHIADRTAVRPLAARLMHVAIQVVTALGLAAAVYEGAMHWH